VSRLTHPILVIDVIPVENPQRAGHGFLLIAVPRSPMAPALSPPVRHVSELGQ
jgi:hypothetical protein